MSLLSLMQASKLGEVRSKNKLKDLAIDRT